jgi:hypothetical protein
MPRPVTGPDDFDEPTQPEIPTLRGRASPDNLGRAATEPADQLGSGGGGGATAFGARMSSISP